MATIEEMLLVGYWVYRVQMYSPRRTVVTECRRILSEADYRVEWIREAEEQIAEEDLRSLEGVTPNTPLEKLGWTHTEEWKEKVTDAD